MPAVNIHIYMGYFLLDLLGLLGIYCFVIMNYLLKLWIKYYFIISFLINKLPKKDLVSLISNVPPIILTPYQSDMQWFVSGMVLLALTV